MQEDVKPKYKVFEIDLSSHNWEKEMQDAFDERFLAETTFYRALLEKVKKDEQ